MTGLSNGTQYACSVKASNAFGAGPASGTASWRTKKMPVPTVAPTPNIISWKVPKLRLRSGP